MPSTSTVAPASIPAVLSTAPTPVCTAHPTTQATSSGTSAGIFTAPCSRTSRYSAKPPTPSPRITRVPLRASPVVPSANVPPYSLKLTGHNVGSSRTQK